MEVFNLARVLKFLPGIVLGLTVHESCHALAAHLCGDSTSKDQGRITLNPLKHIDPLGFLMLIVVGFGWAKPVEFNEEKLRNEAAKYGLKGDCFEDVRSALQNARNKAAESDLIFIGGSTFVVAEVV